MSLWQVITDYRYSAFQFQLVLDQVDPLCYYVYT